MEHDGWTYIYLTGQRKAFEHDTKGWEAMAYERFEYVECGIFRKRTADLTERDKMKAGDYGEPDQNFITPSEWKEPVTAPKPGLPIGLEVSHPLVKAEFQPPVAFPTNIVVNGVGIQMFIDGTWSGDREAFLKAIRELRGQFGLNGALMWLVVRALTPETERKP
jgi:hypothetical protein